MLEPAMKRYLVVLITGICFFTFASTISAQDLRSGKDDPLIGPISIEQLFDIEGWFGADFMSYTPDRSYTSLLKEYLEGVTIKCFLGTWCDDAKLQVPRMLKVLQQAGVDPAQFEMYGLDEDKDSPGDVEDAYNIQKIPTFVLMYKGEEIGRIVEEPIGSLEKDLVGLIMKAFPEEYPFYEGNQPQNDGSDMDAADPNASDDGSEMPPKEPPR
jgi:thiol-disulfide isomerase/thioredoxin